MQKINIEDLCSYQFLSNLRISPDKKHAAFVAHQSNQEKNGYDSAIWTINLEDRSLLQLTAMKDEKNFIWLEDGKTILFSSNRERSGDKKPKPGEAAADFFSISLNGGEARKAFTLPLTVSRLEQIRDGRYLVCAWFDNYLPDLTGMSDHEKQDALKAYEEEQDYMVMDELPFWRDGSGYTNKKRSRLYLYDQENGALEPLTGPLYEVNDWKLNPEHTQVLFTGYQFENWETEHCELAVIDLESKEKTVLIPEGERDIQSIGFTGKDILFTATFGKRFGCNENCCFYLMDPATKEITQISDPDFSIHNSVGSDNRYGGGTQFLVSENGASFIITERYWSRICRMDRSGSCTMLSKPEGSVDCFDQSGELILFIGMRGDRLEEVYQLDPTSGEETQLTHFNTAVLADKEVVTPKYLPFTNQDGIEIDGWVIEPAGYDPSRSYPAILDIHGGPKTVYGTVFFHEMQVWASMGYFVLFCNPRGGDGRGNEFADIRGKYGMVDYDDIMEFVDHVLAGYSQIDPKRLGVTGGSYGGFMTNWIIGHTSRFAAAASQRSISNWISMEGASDIGPRFGLDQSGGDAWDHPEEAWLHSPLKYADQCTTPTLFIHSDQDYRCWMAEALQMFSALKTHHVPARICLFKGECHELSRSGKPKHRIRRLKEISQWFEKYCGKR